MTASAFASAVLFATLFIAAWSDFKSRQIPNRLSIVGVNVAMTLGAFGSVMAWLQESDRWSWLTFSDVLLGSAVTGLLPLVIYVAGSGGAADVKLAWVIGAFLGWRGGSLAVWSAYFMAGIWGLSALVLSGRIWKLAGLYIRTVGYRLLPRRFTSPTKEEWNTFSDAYPMAPFYLAGVILVHWARFRGVD
jgi:Flp pilus assembly protein protease CpaA